MNIKFQRKLTRNVSRITGLTGFFDMAINEVGLEELLANREKLVDQIKSSLVKDDKDFLLGFVSNDPDWKLVRDSKIKDYPSVKWKMMNQEKMSKKKIEDYKEKILRIF